MMMNNPTITGSKKGEKPPALTAVVVSLSPEQVDYAKKFFGVTGMKKAFLDEYSLHKRNNLDYALNNNSFKIALARDVRQFIADHQDEVAEFLNAPAA